MDVNAAEYSKKDMWWAITKTAVVVFTLTMIYARFLTMEIQTKNMQHLIDFNDTEQTRRLDTKTGRNADDIEVLQKEVEGLKAPNSDGKE